MVFMRQHKDLEKLFRLHQEELLRFRLERSKKYLQQFAKALRHHIYIEEKHILPLYEAVVPAQPGGGAFLFLGEHQKIKEFLTKIVSRTSRLDKKNKNIYQKIIELFDLETRFKDIFLHHDMRENNMLYPLLDKAITQEEKKRLVALL